MLLHRRIGNAIVNSAFTHRRIGQAIKSVLLFKFTGQATTNAITGVRELVNTAPNGTNATLYGGQGIDCAGSTMSINTRYTPIVSNGFTLLYGMSATENSCYTGCSTGTNDEFFVGYLNTIIARVAVSNVRMDFKVTKPFNDFALVYDEVNEVSSVALNGSVVENAVSTPNFNPIHPFRIGQIGSENFYLNGDAKDFYYIPCKLTPAEIQSHYTNPERTLYWKPVTQAEAVTAGQEASWLSNGTILVSDLQSITPAVIADMQSGNGFWYPLSENVNAVDQNDIHYATNACLPRPVNLFSNGGFDTDSDWIVQDDKWVIANGVASLSGATSASTSKIHQPMSGDGVTQYIVEVEVKSVTGSLRIAQRKLDGGYISVVDISSVGVKRVLFVAHSDLGRLTFYPTSSGNTAVIDNVKVYPLEGSGLTPINGMTTTAPRTNAEQIEYVLQKPLLTTDAFGVHTGLATNEMLNVTQDINYPISAKGTDNYEIDFVINVRLRPNIQVMRVNYATKLNLTSDGKNLMFYVSGNKLDMVVAEGVRIITLVNTSSKLRYYVDGVLKAASSNVTADINGIDVYGVLDDLFGTIQLFNGNRTDQERTTAVNKLKTKYGIV